MINERKMITILVGTFMVSMVGLLIWTYRKQTKDVTAAGKTAGEISYVQDADLKTEKDNFLSALTDAERRISESISEVASRKEQSTGINLEPGIFL